VPTLFLVGEGDEGFVEHARLLYDATGSVDKRLEIMNSAQHGVLLASEQPTRSLIEQFVAGR
jgi:hypothetical protein